MKRLNLMILIIGVAIIFFGCSKNNSTAPDLNQSDQITNSLKFSGTTYTGVSDPVPGGIFEPGEWTFLPNDNVKIHGMVAEWYDTANEALLTGTSMWYENWKFNLYKPKVKFWGSATIAVEGGEGVWQGSWHGYGTFSGPTPYDFWTSPLVAEIDVVFTGHGGEIQGMVAKVKYNIDTSVAFQWSFVGEYK